MKQNALVQLRTRIKSQKRQRRSRFEIIVDILKVARRGASKTRIVFRANLNFKIVQPYLDELEEAELIQCVSGNIKTTKKGFEFLEYSSKLKELLAVKKKINQKLHKVSTL